MATFARICKEIKDSNEVTILFVCFDTKTNFPNDAMLLLALSIECQVDEDIKCKPLETLVRILKACSGYYGR